MTRVQRPGWWWLLVAVCVLLLAAPAAAQEDPGFVEAPPPQIDEGLPPADDAVVEDGQDRVRDMIYAPFPVADQSEPDWWNRTGKDWRLEANVLQTYRNFWIARAEALRKADARLLEHTTAGPVLERDRAAIDALRAQGQIQILQVEHFPEVLEAVADEGVVYDSYLNSTYNADARTGKRLDPEYSPVRLTLVYRLQPVDGVWKVVDAIRFIDDEGE
jgi:hypothetical protein